MDCGTLFDLQDSSGVPGVPGVCPHAIYEPYFYPHNTNIRACRAGRACILAAIGLL